MKVSQTTQFRKDARKQQKRGKDLGKLIEIVNTYRPDDYVPFKGAHISDRHLFTPSIRAFHSEAPAAVSILAEEDGGESAHCPTSGRIADLPHRTRSCIVQHCG